MIEETFDYKNVNGEVSGSVNVEFYFNNESKIIEVEFNNKEHSKHPKHPKHPKHSIKIVSAQLNDKDFMPFTTQEDWLTYEDEIIALIEDLESEPEPEHTGYGYNQSDIKWELTLWSFKKIFITWSTEVLK